MKVTKSSQLLIKCPDEAGQLAKVLGIIADAGINGVAYAGYAQGGEGHMMVVTENNARAAQFIKNAGYQVREEPVVLVRDSDQRGSAVAMAKKIAAAGISLTGVYASAAGGDYITVLQAKDVDKLVAALK